MMKAICIGMLVVLSAGIFYYIGFFEYHGEEGYKKVFFIKKTPSLKLEFENPAMMTYEQRNFYYSDGLGLNKLAEYCHHRYGVKGTQVEILEQCGKIENITLPND